MSHCESQSSSSSHSAVNASATAFPRLLAELNEMHCLRSAVRMKSSFKSDANRSGHYSGESAEGVQAEGVIQTLGEYRDTASSVSVYSRKRKIKSFLSDKLIAQIENDDFVMRQENRVKDERIELLNLMNYELVSLRPGDTVYTRVESGNGHILFAPHEVLTIRVQPKEAEKVPASANIEGEIRVKSLSSSTFSAITFTSGYSTTSEMRMVEILPMRLGEVENVDLLQQLYASFFHLSHKQSLTFSM